MSVKSSPEQQEPLPPVLIDNQADEDELEYFKACQYALESFNNVRGLCPKCKKSVIIDGWVCPCCGYDSSGEELYKYGD